MIPLKNPAVFGYTLGCRLNSYETEALVEELVSVLGGRRAASPEEADLLIVNTCAVTARSQARSRRAVKSYSSRFPGTVIVVTGCVAEVSPEDFSGLGGLVEIVPNRHKDRLVSMFVEDAPASGEENCLFPACTPVSASRTRAFLKIQDGCDNRCAYCIVPLARGGSRSQPRESVLRQAKALKESGYREICLTGVDIADYGRHIYGKEYGLPELVEDLLEMGGYRLRIGSVEPMYLTVQTLEKLARQGVCRHFHIPFQSGSDRILEAMGRGYCRQQEEELLTAMNELFPGACVGSDFIAGFPGENGEDFEQTLSLASDPRISYLHVFPFSPRPGTPAADMKPVHTETITGRAVTLRKVSAVSRRSFRTRMIGTRQTMLVEGRMLRGANIGFTDNYIPAFAPSGATEGDLVELELNRSNICWGQR